MTVKAQFFSSDSRRLVAGFVFLYTLQVLIGAVVMYHFYIQSNQASLSMLTERVQQNITYQNGSWDVSTYKAHPLIPDRFRLYVLSVDGFVIDRWRPISGFLDLSDMKYLLGFQTPQTVETITNQRWRVFSLPIPNGNNNSIGVIAVSFYEPDLSKIQEIDRRLVDTAQAIEEKLVVTGDQIDTSAIFRKDTPFDITFQVVSQYNHMLISSSNANSMNSMPTFIDPSYVSREMRAPHSRQIKSASGANTFLVESQPMMDEDGQPVGVIIGATSISIIYDLLQRYLLLAAGLGVLLTGVFANFVKAHRQHIEKLTFEKLQQTLRQKTKPLSAEQVTRIHFDKKACVLTINTTSFEFTYATNQYYLLSSLFASPRKKWETDELIEKFGEEWNKNSWRKVYDAMAAINAKTAECMTPKLIVVSNKTYQINPRLLSKLDKA